MPHMCIIIHIRKNARIFDILESVKFPCVEILTRTRITVRINPNISNEKQMEEKKVDRRIAKTKKAIYRAFAELLSEKNVNDITIKDIADRADINRKTFYNYYDGIYELTSEIENKIIDSFAQMIRQHNVNELLHNPNEMFQELVRIINTDLDFYQHLISIESNSNLVSKLFKTLKSRAKEVISEHTVFDDATLDIVLDFVISGMFTVFQHWFNSSRERSIDDMAKIVATLTYNGINGLIKDYEK